MILGKSWLPKQGTYEKQEKGDLEDFDRVEFHDEELIAGKWLIN